ncbi:helix-turn-helix transcriptional regulator [Wukongibacter baidiensis]|uniref:helix-turn-helix domain-containing protein n=1 Tax=Wukongibacter baidiensis TaxID=1723361 RepID=UPI003D7FAB3D
MKFGDKLKKLREEKGLTQTELGDMFSVSEAAIYFCENNRRPPTYSLLNKLAKYFKVTPQYLLGYDDIDKTILGERLKDLREKFFLTQHDLGGIINIPQNTISNYEKGKSFPSLENLYLLADYFDTSIDYLVGRTGRKELVFVEDIKLQEIGKKYLEVDNKFTELGLSPKRVLEIITALDSVGLINKKEDAS